MLICLKYDFLLFSRQQNAIAYQDDPTERINFEVMPDC